MLRMWRGCGEDGGAWLVRIVLLFFVVALLCAMGIQGVWAVWLQHTTQERFSDLGGYIMCDGCLLFFVTLEAELIVAVAIMSIGTAFSFLWLFFKLRQLLRAYPASMCMQPAKGLRTIFLAVKAFAKKRETDQEAESIAREFERIRLRMARMCLRKICPLLVVGMITSTYFNIQVISDNIDGREHLTRRQKIISYLFSDESMPFVFMGAVAVIFDIAPFLVTPRGMDCANMFLSGMWAWRLMVMTGSYYEYNKYWMLGCRIVQGFVFGNAHWTIALNGFVVATDIAVSNIHVQDPLLAGLQTGYREIGIFALSSMTFWTFEHLQREEAFAIVRAQNSDHASTLVQQALSSMCDAVAKLDQKLCLTDSCPRLSSMLLRQGPLLPGTQFTDFMSAGEADRFRASLARSSSNAKTEEASTSEQPALADRPSQDSSFTGLCHVKLTDGSNSKVPVEVFYSCVPYANGQLCYLVGIKEDRDEVCGRGADESPDELSEPEPTKIRIKGLAALPESATTGQGVRSISSWSSASKQSDNEDPHVWVDTASDNLRVLGFSRSFMLLGGSQGSCKSLSEWISRKNLESTHDWLASRSTRSHRVHMKTHAGWTYKCKFTVDDVDEPPPPASSSACPCRLAVRILGIAAVKEDAMKAAQSKKPNSVGRLEAGVDTRVLELYVTILDKVIIGKALGPDPTVCSKFRDYPLMREWVDRPREFILTLRGILKELSNGGDEDRVRTLGVYTFLQPGELAPKVSFLARVDLMPVHNLEADFPFCLRVTPLQDIARTAPPGAASTSQAPAPQPTLPSTLHL